MPEWHIDFSPRVDATSIQAVRLVAEIDTLVRCIRAMPLPPEVRSAEERARCLGYIKATLCLAEQDVSERCIDQVVAEHRSDPPSTASSAPLKSLAGAGEAAGKREILNLWDTWQHVVVPAGKRLKAKVTKELILSIHRSLCRGTEYPHNLPGDFRRDQAYWRDFRFPAPDRIPSLVDRLIAWVNGSGEAYGPVIKALLTHFYLVSIRPFTEANGRTARILEAFLLSGSGYAVLGHTSFSPFFARHKEEYFRLLHATRYRFNGNATELTFFTLKGYRDELRAVHESAVSRLGEHLLRGYCLRLIQRGELSQNAAQLVDHLLAHPGRGIPLSSLREGEESVARRLYQGRPAVELLRDLKSLDDHGLIVRRGDVLYVERYADRVVGRRRKAVDTPLYSE